MKNKANNNSQIATYLQILVQGIQMSEYHEKKINVWFKVGARVHGPSKSHFAL